MNDNSDKNIIKLFQRKEKLSAKNRTAQLAKERKEEYELLNMFRQIKSQRRRTLLVNTASQFAFLDEKEAAEKLANSPCDKTD